MRKRRMLAGFVPVAMVAGLFAPGSPASAAPDGAGGTMVVGEGQVRADGTVVRSERTVRVSSSRGVDGAKPAAPVAAAVSKVHPALAAALARSASAGAQRTRLVVTFREDQKVPQLPSLDSRQSREAPANRQVQSQADAMIAKLASARASGYQRLGAELSKLDVRTLDTFWLVKGVVVDAPLVAVAALAARGDVQYVEPAETDTPPPTDSDPANDEEDARALMRTDPYFNAGYNGGYIGLLDTGVRATHTVFNNPSHLGFREDMTNPSNPNPDDDCWNHGTSSAAIITGNGNLGAAWRGETSVVLDSFKVYPSGCGGLNIAATVSGFQRAVAVLDRVIVVETQPTGTETDALSTAADAAFDAGAAVIAANGNFGPGASSVRSPALAQKVIGVGAADLKTQSLMDYSGRGPAADGRTKPDLLGPTNVETASSASSTASQVFTGTSCATPQTGGATALLRNFMRGSNFDIAPGLVYAALIANGKALGTSAAYDQANGAGLLRLPINGNAWWSSTTVTNQQNVNFQISVPATSNGFNIAIWWPESPATHSDVDLQVTDPSGVVRGSSTSVSSVFERVALGGPTAAGNWSIRIRGYSVPSGVTQTVYWSAATVPA